MGRETSARQDQAHPLGWKDIKEFIDSAGEGLRADRERAMLCVAYETLARRGELVATWHPGLVPKYTRVRSFRSGV
jgi:integrase